MAGRAAGRWNQQVQFRAVGIYGYYARISLADLECARMDDAFRRSVVYERWQQEQEANPDGWVPGGADPVAVATDKNWDAIFFTLAQAGLPRRLVDGQPISDEDEPPTPRYLMPDDVADVARHIADRSFADLVAAVDLAKAKAAELYGAARWDPDEQAVIAAHGRELPQFFTAAAAAGEVVIIHIEF